MHNIDDKHSTRPEYELSTSVPQFPAITGSNEPSGPAIGGTVLHSLVGRIRYLVENDGPT